MAEQIKNELSQMQQEVLNRADAIFSSIASTVSSTVDFAKEQIPDIAVQFITYSRAYYTLVEILGFIFLSLVYWLVVSVAFKNRFKCVSPHNEWHGARVGALLFGLLLIIPTMGIIFGNTKTFLLVWFAPKIFLIQSLVNLAKGIV